MKNLREKILLDKLDGLEKLAPGERIDVRASEDFSASMAENRLLAGLAAGAPPAPERLHTLQRAMEAPSRNVINPGGLAGGLSWMFSRRSLYIPALFSVFMLSVAAALCTLLVPSHSDAYMDGYMLVYNMGPRVVPETRAANGRLQPRIHVLDSRVLGMQRALVRWNRSRRLGLALLGQKPRNVVSFVEEEQGSDMIIKVGLASADERMLHEIRRAMDRVPGVPEPEVSDATWISAGKVDLEQQGLSIQMGNRTMNFPPGFSESQMEGELNEWLAINRPGYRAKVAFVKSGEQTDVQVQLLEASAPPVSVKDGSGALQNGLPAYSAGR